MSYKLRAKHKNSQLPAHCYSSAQECDARDTNHNTDKGRDELVTPKNVVHLTNEQGIKLQDDIMLLLEGMPIRDAKFTINSVLERLTIEAIVCNGITAYPSRNKDGSLIVN